MIIVIKIIVNHKKSSWSQKNLNYDLFDFYDDYDVYHKNHS